MEAGDRIVFVQKQNNQFEIQVMKKRSLRDALGVLPVKKALPFEQEREKARQLMGQQKK